jgi:hypothetical protein
MILGIIVDGWGSSQAEPDEEMQQIEDQIKELLPEGTALTVKKELPPYKLIEGEKCDIFVMDYGGATMGATDMVWSFLDDFIKAAQERPNTLFILWSSIMVTMFVNTIQQEMKVEFNHYAPQAQHVNATRPIANIFMAPFDAWEQDSEWRKEFSRFFGYIYDEEGKAQAVKVAKDFQLNTVSAVTDDQLVDPNCKIKE